MAALANGEPHHVNGRSRYPPRCDGPHDDGDGSDVGHGRGLHSHGHVRSKRSKCSVVCTRRYWLKFFFTEFRLTFACFQMKSIQLLLSAKLDATSYFFTQSKVCAFEQNMGMQK